MSPATEAQYLIHFYVNYSDHLPTLGTYFLVKIYLLYIIFREELYVLTRLIFNIRLVAIVEK